MKEIDGADKNGASADAVLELIVKPGFFDVTDCTECPCMSRCYDENSCNLNYDHDLRWRDDKELIYCSKNCQLESVNFGDEVFEKDKARVTNTRPEKW